MTTLTAERGLHRNARHDHRPTLGVVSTPAASTPAAPAVPCVGTDALLARARSEVLIMCSRAVAVNSPLSVIRSVNHENLRRGVRYRILVPDEARTTPMLAPRLNALSTAGAVIRTVPTVPSDALVIDRDKVVLPAGRADMPPATGVTVSHLAGVVTTTVGLFEWVWCTAAPLCGSDLPDTDGLGARDQELLSLLAIGLTDAAAAKELGISVRTVRRMVSGIMNRLGARSRFMAGAKAADRGWLMAKAG